VHDLTRVQWAALQAAWGGCAYCGTTDKALQKDCVLPRALRGVQRRALLPLLQHQQVQRRGDELDASQEAGRKSIFIDAR
jgi:hypothetical protein